MTVKTLARLAPRLIVLVCAFRPASTPAESVQRAICFKRNRALPTSRVTNRSTMAIPACAISAPTCGASHRSMTSRPVGVPQSHEAYSVMAAFFKQKLQ